MTVDVDAIRIIGYLNDNHKNNPLRRFKSQRVILYPPLTQNGFRKP